MTQLNAGFYYLMETGTSLTRMKGYHKGAPSAQFLQHWFYTIIEPIDKSLRERAHYRKLQGNLGDDKNGDITNLLVYVDDLNCVIP